MATPIRPVSPDELNAVRDYFAGGDVQNVVAEWKATAVHDREAFAAEIAWEADGDWDVKLSVPAIVAFLDLSEVGGHY